MHALPVSSNSSFVIRRRVLYRCSRQARNVQTVPKTHPERPALWHQTAMQSSRSFSQPSCAGSSVMCATMKLPAASSSNAKRTCEDQGIRATHSPASIAETALGFGAHSRRLGANPYVPAGCGMLLRTRSRSADATFRSLCLILNTAVPLKRQGRAKQIVNSSWGCAKRGKLR